MGKELDVATILSKMTLEQKAGLCSGADFWHTASAEELGLPSVMVSDGPHGLRKQEEDVDHMGVAESIKAVCFPTASAMACSFNRELLYTVGNALGEECIAEDVAVLLGPGINMKRSPLCGRNFEYYSEDPLLTGRLASAMVRGIQSVHIGAVVKHFALNNKETNRKNSDSRASERAVREIYLRAFEIIVKEAKPWAIMSSYNIVNGYRASENRELLEDILRGEWGFDGMVTTDWWTNGEHYKEVKAGNDMKMALGFTERLLEALKCGALTRSEMETCAKRVLGLILKAE